MAHITKKIACRRKRILEEISRKGYLSISDLSTILSVSVSTIKRDLSVMSSEGVIGRTHGGANLFVDENEVRIKIPVFSERQLINADKKNRIARIAARFIRDNDTVFLDSGTTINLILPFLKAKNLTVHTNNLSILLSAFNKEYSFSIHLLNGLVDFNHLITLSIDQIESIKPINFTRALFSCRSLSPEKGLIVSDYVRKLLATTIADNSKEIIVCADSSKFNMMDKITALPFDRINYLITDDGITDKQRYIIEGFGTKILTE